MASLKYNNPPGACTTYGEMCHYSQTVDLGNGFVKCAGQGGWIFETGELDANDSTKQVQLAVKNVDNILQAAGLRGWEDVYMVRTYHTDIRTTFQAVVDALKERIPNHKPVWTCIAVPHLALPAMLIEIEVEAKRQD
ncbi:hypothetical protein E8E12_004927 [Didymella heteroderae]|uniref:YjgF-like protein n=1 Tax=Didymella heteroderae TaxID=1769908 RepID=A0A9P5C2G9_9PLEO|nr:hypothetical protein E8E12_004927 [Didymella heteroderae]